MKKALKAFSPGDKMYNIQRIHSKLIYLSKYPDALNDKFSDKYSIDMILDALERSVMCFTEDLRGKKTDKKIKHYLNAIRQTKSHVNKYRLNNWNSCIISFCYMSGMFMLLRANARKKIIKFCEFEYQDICVPLFRLDQIYIKKRK